MFASCREPASAASLGALTQAYPERLTVLSLDVADERSIEHAAARFAEQAARADLIVNVAGLLHGPDFYPEKKLEHVDPKALRKVFEVNAFGTLLVAKHFHRFLRHEDRSVLASLSARTLRTG